jgi:hypothetical protein
MTDRKWLTNEIEIQEKRLEAARQRVIVFKEDLGRAEASLSESRKEYAGFEWLIKHLKNELAGLEGE